MKKEVFELNGNPNTTLTTYLLETETCRHRRPLMIVLPGGVFLDCSPYEGEPVALQYLAAGFHAAVLIYSTDRSNPGKSMYPYPLFDMAQAIVTVRKHAEEWNVDPDKIYIMGFSAGGNLSALYSNLWHTELLKDYSTPEMRKPNAAVLCYALTDGLMNLEDNQRLNNPDVNLEQVTGRDELLQMQDLWHRITAAQYGTDAPSAAMAREFSPIEMIGKNTPPTFLWATFGDMLVNPFHSLDYARRLHENGVPCELHLYEKGNHGLALADESSAVVAEQINPHVASWMKLSIEWLKDL